VVGNTSGYLKCLTISSGIEKTWFSDRCRGIMRVGAPLSQGFFGHILASLESARKELSTSTYFTVVGNTSGYLKYSTISSRIVKTWFSDRCRGIMRVGAPPSQGFFGHILASLESARKELSTGICLDAFEGTDGLYRLTFFGGMAINFSVK
jgi:hypothetical protein